MSAHAFACRASVSDGRLALDAAAKAQLRRFAQQCGDGVELVLKLEEKKDTRSLAQNRTLWGPVYDQILAEVMRENYRADEAEAPLETSYAKQLVHYGLLAKRFGYVTDPVTKMQVPARTSSELNTREFAEYLVWVQTYCASELHIEVELPDEIRQAAA